MKNYLLSAKNYILTPQEISNGITGFGKIKFYIALAFYLTASIMLFRDPFFLALGEFSYKQGFVVLFLGFLIISALNWEFLLFGKPSGANLFLQIIQFLPFALLCARLLASPSQPSVPVDFLSGIKTFIYDTSFSLFSWIPGWIRDIFVNWQISLLLLFVMMIFCFRSLKLKIGALSTLFLYVLATNIMTGVSLNLILGIVFLLAGWWLQFCPYSKVVFFENVVRKLKSTTECDEIFLQVSCRAMTCIYENGRMGENTLSQIVKTEYSRIQRYSDLDIKIITGEITRKLLYEYKLVELKSDADGLFLSANPRLYQYEGLLSWVSVCPRIIMIFFISIFWIISPIDIIPDAIPVFGVLDDVAIAIISAIAIRNSANELKDR